MNKWLVRTFFVAALLAVAGVAQARKDDLDVQRLNTSLNQLASDPTLGGYAQAEQTLARVAVQRLQQAGRKERAHLLYLAERSVDQARASAQLEDAQHQLDQLGREHDSILLKASQLDAEATRRALERERLRNQLAQEETQRLQAQGMAYSQAAEQAKAEAEQARKLADAQAKAAKLARHQAHLAEQAALALRAQLEGMTARRGDRGMEMTLQGDAFAPGQADLKREARQHLGKLLKFVRGEPGKRILIEGYTDSSGNAAANKALSLRRARAVRDALVAAGIKPSRMHVEGKGEANPVASNRTATGRARNRRVVVILAD